MTDKLLNVVDSALGRFNPLSAAIDKLADKLTPGLVSDAGCCCVLQCKYTCVLPSPGTCHWTTPWLRREYRRWCDPCSGWCGSQWIQAQYCHSQCTYSGWYWC